MSFFKKALLTIIAVLVISGAGFIFFKFYFVFGEGVKAGELNQIVYKGWVWKTYEGRLIQTGFKGAKGGGNIQSNEFEFSVVDANIANELMHNSGKMVELHYKEYRGALPWRGMQKYVVDEIVSIKDTRVDTTIPPLDGASSPE